MIGLPSTSTPEGTATFEARFLESLRAIGWVEGQEFEFVRVYANAVRDEDTLRALAEELVAMEPDIIVTAVPIATQAVARITATIPIVAPLIEADFEEFVGNPAHPEGNVTGTYRDLTTLVGKQIELAKDILPGISRVGYLNDTTSPFHDRSLEAVERAAAAHGLTLIRADFSATEEIVPAFQKLVTEGVDAVTLSGGLHFLFPDRNLIEQQAIATELPWFHPFGPTWVENGAIAAYTIDGAEGRRTRAEYVVKILEGTNPGDLPVFVTEAVKLSINMKTARDLDFEFPAYIFALADTVYE